MRQKRRFIWSCAVFLMIVLFVNGCGKTQADDLEQKEDVEAESASDVSGEDAQEEPEPEEEADTKAPYNDGQMPMFTTKDLNGDTVTESVFAEKDLTVVNIWGTFCNPCIGEMPALGEWAREMPDNVQLVGLISDFDGENDKEHHDLAVQILEAADADFQQIIANQDFAPVMDEVVGVPTTIFVDSEGKIVGEPIIGANVEGYKRFVEEYFSEQ